MKRESIIIIAAACLGLYMVSKMTAPQVPSRGRPGTTIKPLPGNVGRFNYGSAELLNGTGSYGPYEFVNPAKPGDSNYGYRYFQNGVVIGPDGTRYDDPNYVVPGLERYLKQ